MDIRIYTDEVGQAPFEEWLNALKDVQGRARIWARLACLQPGNFGDGFVIARYKHLRRLRICPALQLSSNRLKIEAHFFESSYAPTH